MRWQNEIFRERNTTQDRNASGPNPDNLGLSTFRSVCGSRCDLAGYSRTELESLSAKFAAELNT